MKPEIAASAWIAENATVRGSVKIGDEVSIWYGAVVRAEGPAVVIGEGSNVQDNCVIHTDPRHEVHIGKGVTIGHNATVHGCTIGDHTLIGMGAVVLNGARIGRDCLIGAGALVTQNMVIPDGSLAFGSPARVVRPLREDELSFLRANAQHYIDIAKEYRTGAFG